MGRIHLSFFRNSELHQRPQHKTETPPPGQAIARNIDERLEVDKDQQTTEHVEFIKETNRENEYPKLSRKVKEADLPFIPADEIERRNAKEDKLWIIVSDTVLDVAEYVHRHPGGRSIIAGFAGQDCTWQWYSFHNHAIWDKVAMDLRVGRTQGVRNPFERPTQTVGLRKLGFDDWD